MMPRPKKMASPKGQTAKVPAQEFTFPAPIRGWVLNENLSNPQPGGARVLDNWFCTTTGIKARGGRQKFATLDAKVQSIFTYKSGSQSILFGATATKIYDITSPASPTVVPTAAVTGMTSGYYSTEHFGTAGGNFLVVCNGTNSVRNFNGSAWSTPTITGVTSANLSQVWSHSNHLFFIEKNTMNAWYLPVDSISGTVAQISLAGVMTKGGSLVFGAKWSLDAGDGLDDKCVFVSSEGEVAVYEGTNPGSALAWSLVGVYILPKPMGKNARIAAGGDLLIATEVGLIPMSAAINRDIAAMEQAAVSKPIGTYWQAKAKLLAGTNWEMVKSPDVGIMIVSQPSTAASECLVVNMLTGGWSRFTGWDVQCLGYIAGQTFCGSADSCVYVLNVGGSDSGENYTCVYLGQADPMGLYGKQKTILQMRAVVNTSVSIMPQLTAQVNYSEALSSPPSSPADYSVDSWDSGIWDTSLWDASTPLAIVAQWAATGKTGRVVAPELQLTFGITPTPNTELVAIDAQFSAGAVVT